MRTRLCSNLEVFFLLLASLLLVLASWDSSCYRLLISSEKDELVHKDELQRALERASAGDEKEVIITTINKAYVEPVEDEYPTMLDLFLEGFWVGEGTRHLIDRLMVVTMDETAHQRCLFQQLNCYRLVDDDDEFKFGDDRFSGEKIYMTEGFIEMMWRRTLFLNRVLKRGFNFIFTDADILWLRNPFTMLGKNTSLDLELSVDKFNGDPYSEENPVNTGFYFIRSNQKTIKLLETWYGRRNNSTGMKEQDVLRIIMQEGSMRKLEMNVMFLDHLYFSGFCKDSEDIGSVITIHADCCRGIKAKIAESKLAIKDWKRFRNEQKNGLWEDTKRFRWRNHTICRNSWPRQKWGAATATS